MALEIGRRLGPYEIVATLGAGGVGEVYRAQDTKLGRQVALKVLQQDISQDQETLTRFAREAKALASLNIPTVATIYGIDEYDGVLFLVMELVPGQTLAERIKEAGALPLKEALSICLQLAEALEASHDKGIIHRDLKPANVKVTPEGKAKLLDFGLAKALTPEAGGQSEGQATLQYDATRPGVVLGTPTYMSPEQTRGQPVDKRADIWAFGCVLYETLTGKRAFLGQTISDVFSSILEKEPDWEALPAKTPDEVRKLLQRCLCKELNRRLRDIGEARIVLEEVTRDYARTQEIIASERLNTNFPKTATGAPVAAAPDSKAIQVGAPDYSAPPPDSTPRPYGVPSRPVNITRPQFPPPAPPARGMGMVVLVAVIFLLALGAGLAYVFYFQNKGKSVAVLPFETTGGDLGLKVRGDEFQRQVTNKLTQAGRFSVANPADVAKLNPGLSPQDAGRQLDVGAVLTCTIQKNEGAISVHLKLIKVHDNSVLWSPNPFEVQADQFEAKIADFTNEIAKAVREKLK
jgi:serine/threonine protein kinase/TolB-like protein